MAASLATRVSLDRLSRFKRELGSANGAGYNLMHSSAIWLRLVMIASSLTERCLSMTSSLRAARLEDQSFGGAPKLATELALEQIPRFFRSRSAIEQCSAQVL